MGKSYFSNRGSVRAYDKMRHISDDELKEILEEAAHAPNTGNMQLYSVIVTRSQPGKDALAPAHFNQPAVTGCDVLLTVCADVNRFAKWCEVGKAEAGMDNFQAYVYSMIDAAIYAQQVVTIAEMRGIGTCYMGTTTYNAPMIAEQLGLPDGVAPVATITMGYPEVEPSPSDRLPLDGIMHEERYHDYTPADIRLIYSHKEHLEENKEYVKANGKVTLAQVYAEVRYTRADNEFFSTVLYDYLNSHGFPFPKK